MKSGDQIGDFLLGRVLGSGGMGIVFEARSPRHKEPVAIKILRRNADDHDVRRFQTEARAVQRLRHPNIVKVLEHGQSPEGLWYMAMELVDGEALDQILERDGPMEPVQAARVCIELAAALTYAHEYAVLHRDLKPHNVIVDREGTARLTDFGLAKILGEESLTRTGDVVGTPVYMSPEQAEADKLSISERTDVYGLGATLYHMATGRRPFDARGLGDLLLKIVRDRPRPLREVRAEVPERLERIVLRCMQKNPHDRYPDMAALSTDLERFVSGRGEGLFARLASAFKSCPLWGGAAAGLLYLGVRLL